MSVPRVLRTGGSAPAHALRAVVVEGFTTRLAFGVVIFAMPLYARQLGMSLAEIGVLVAMKPLVELIVKPFMGWTVDRWGARRGYLTAVTVRLVASMLLFTAATPASLYLVRLVQGAASAARDPASISVVAAPARGNSAGPSRSRSARRTWAPCRRGRSAGSSWP
ncbi:MFS transporter [Actinomadura madurae]|uniref:MFS transporter n=1 Tax=Actinomadura madurae TaxID=1993 RepID=UPI0020D200FF|nr:MFS transporter [Actinomadura madurae]MCQ0017721.1 MFS transporter [Actinomadura madurae]